ncbi:wd-40 repeat protein [Stylonychia lemnae]|uniref:Wd-40 repeat protein n=1 Tax=Stylonychia lemnae TaxID=5949 RepID=A0A078AIE2_STYLE|nr:wd-40 repeat protein [Stylonychia lemnae]|eukprot:CDW82015.1 wd-40 repeat protein [Stylonychia lemnae]
MAKIFIKDEEEMAGYFQIDITDKLIDDYKQIRKQDNEYIIKEMTTNLSKYLKFIPGIGTCFGVFQNNLVALEFIAKQLSLRDKLSIPILICQKMLTEESPLDFSVKAHQRKISNIMLQILIKYQDHILFNELVDKNFCNLIKQQIDLQEYFESNLPKYEILTRLFSDYPRQHNDHRELIVGVNLDNPKDVEKQYRELFRDKLSRLNEKDFTTLVSIEYYLINLPITLQKNPTYLMQVLSETENPEYFENRIIQTIINFKWNQYTRKFYHARFYVYLIFMASFFTDIFYSTYSLQNTNQEQRAEDQRSEISQFNRILKIITKIVCCLVLAFFSFEEVKQLLVQKGKYFKNGWNYFDFLHIITYVAFCIIEFTNQSQDTQILIQITVIFLTFMKLLFFLRIYDGISFLIQMLVGVFKDLRYFLILFLIFILQFGMIFLVLFKAGQIEEYNGVDKLAYFLMVFRISSGDFQMDDYHNQGDLLVVFSWIIWLITVLTLNIVFMNFIIAVISESYERVMQKLVAESYKVKASLIFERELLFNQIELKMEKYFPNYIVGRRPLNTEIKEAGEWQGFIKDLKQTIRTTVTKAKGEIIQNIHSVQSQNHQKIDELFSQNSKYSCSNEGLEEMISKLVKQNQEENPITNNNLNQLKQSIVNEDESIRGDIKELNIQMKNLENYAKFIDSQTKQLDLKVDGLDLQVKGLDKKVDGIDQRFFKVQEDINYIKDSLTLFFQKQQNQ